MMLVWIMRFRTGPGGGREGGEKGARDETGARKDLKHGRHGCAGGGFGVERVEFGVAAMAASIATRPLTDKCILLRWFGLSSPSAIQTECL